ncbi:MAG TPA: hypothetical protein VFW62_13405, partial [bacterium]|nr:hypothetical protein [bacterium]
LLPSLIVLIFIALISMLSHFYSATPPELGAATFFGPWSLLKGTLAGDPAFFDTVRHFSIERVGLWENPGLAAAIGFNILFILLMLRKA